MSISSPCISLCQMDDVSKLCKGCWRSIGEIIAWSSHDDEAKKQVWALIALRKNEAVASNANTKAIDKS